MKDVRPFLVRFASIGGLTLAFLFFIFYFGLKLGIDLSGGTILVYEVKGAAVAADAPATKAAAKGAAAKGAGPATNAAATGVNVDDLIQALKRRINPDGVYDRPIRKIGSNRIEVILSEASSEVVADVKKKMTDVGSLEFRILANRKHDAAAIDRALGPNGLSKPPARYTWAKLGTVISGTNPQVKGQVLTDPALHLEEGAFSGLNCELTGKGASGTEQTSSATIASNTANTITLAGPTNLTAVTGYRVEKNPSSIQAPPPTSQRPGDPIVRDEKVTANRTDKYILIKAPTERQNVTGQYLARTYSTTDERLQPAVGFTFNRLGARKFGDLTRSHLPEESGAFKYQLAVILDGVVMSAPSINSEIRESGIIEGGNNGFRAKEVNSLIEILQSGSLPASLNPQPLQEEQIGPTLGEDTIQKGIRAIEISMLVVPIFMIIYYRFAGVVAVVALVLNIVLLLGSMALFRATFTLPGLAGLALTIGMAVDANVLVFERMREEKERGAALGQQIRNGFNRAWITILDSHVTNFLAGLVLYAIGTEDVKGFALTMIIGMIWNLFTAVYVSRVIFDFWYAQGWLKKTTMMKIMDRPNYDFIGPRKYCMAGSLIVIALGLALFAYHGRSMYNIDFTGGTLVTIRLNGADSKVKELTPPQRAGFVREAAAGLHDVTVESLNVRGEEQGLRFNIRTTDKDVRLVSEEIQKSFGTALEKVSLAAGPATPIPAEPPSAGAPATRFGGGRQYDLRFNLPQPASRVASAFAQVLATAKVDNPTNRFDLVNAKAAPDAPVDATATTLTLKTDLEPEVADAQIKALGTAMQTNPNLLFERLENFSGVVADETRALAVTATFASWLIIAGYLWFRFKSFTYGAAAIIAVVHDVLITLGAVAATHTLALIPGFREVLQIEPFKIDLPMIAAFLTLIGFSVNDTIVIFDRIREMKGKTPYLTGQMINDALNQTLSRTILTSFTAWLVVLILYLFGGEGLHGFAFSLVVGFLSGTYSTIYIATPILIDWAGGKRPAPATAAGKQMATSR